ncbi:hypothetical protein GCM10010174_84830 [Kutzneria viridogrisea]|uniref:HTH tetR-type domain-containing protein n=2 Tax=Kutzneria TaxID=43356 RepID=W5VZP5_9PSEU|nr:TetR/AcrR family transcriptional regulator [Kutzneria albida]AHH94047.1 hypothetical protein KALB_672 [Kutzneria albida DSM 43870]MBA8930947.1 AcrR family transcriptional regulator [Kutzneria viridogrisea]
MHDQETGAGRRLLPRRERAASIRQAAARAFARGGYVGTSMEDLATEAGVTKIILYRHYPTKRELYRSALDNTWEQLVATAGIGYDTEEGLRALFRAARNDPDGFTLLFRHAVREPEFAEHANELMSQSVQLADRALGQSVTDPVLRSWLAKVVTELVVNGVLTWLATGSADRDEEAAGLLFRTAAAAILQHRERVGAH